jgi:hypothetical protein
MANFNSAGAAYASNQYQSTVQDMESAGINPLALYKGASLDNTALQTGAQVNLTNAQTQQAYSQTAKNYANSAQSIERTVNPFEWL